MRFWCSLLLLLLLSSVHSFLANSNKLQKQKIKILQAIRQHSNDESVNHFFSNGGPDEVSYNTNSMQHNAVIQQQYDTTTENVAIRSRIQSNGLTAAVPLNDFNAGLMLGLEYGQRLAPGKIISFRFKKKQSYEEYGGSQTQYQTQDIKDYLTIRTTTPEDDFNIAALRLNVFWNHRNDDTKFLERSIRVLASRRRKGAQCLVATLDDSFYQFNLPQPGQPCPKVAGSIECSVHEFFNTQLGRTRLASKILYITEVAVARHLRRRGVGAALLKALDQYSLMRGVETLFLHVDVENTAAIQLYLDNGYYIVDQNVLHKQFTKSLNLQDYATRGKCHYLLSKDLLEPTIVNVSQGPSSYNRRRS